jgi:putative ABC transport system substrate-binding protein
MSYGPSGAETLRVVATYIARILKGDKPADLAVQQSTRTEMILNLKTARLLDIRVPPTLLALATEVIE